ncbi:M16 family metallopeptidase [Roseitranquillus sediminis]|uniref:M16 family metallopeptidase n=1 Tax=Roseitranquillus sediminis TaxID=2809051 RepID=UPI001D0C35EC|nr:pitrilysin family protein [Roseitranquillus sediminis]MBM9593670.1 insulinase family protein [Roseitranquillus sediminis]
MIRRLAALAATCLALPAWADDHVTTFALENGMEVVVIEDHRAPVVVHMVWYRVGSADEPAGKSGIAHYLEHLMFKGTDDVAPGEFSDLVAAQGGTDNAFTSYDYTGYFQRVAADRLDLMMELEADRMRGLALTEELALPERAVVLEERTQRTDSDPGSVFSEQRTAAQYLAHPYGIPVIGWRHEIAELTLDDALGFYRENYAPNNAIVVVAGDVQPDEVRALAEEHYGPLEPNPELEPRARPQEPPQLVERRMTYSDPRVAQPYIVRTYLAPERDPGDQREAAVLTMLSELLGGSSATSWLGRQLQFDEPLAIYTSAFYNGLSVDDTTFGLTVVPAPGVALDEAEAALDEALARFVEEGVDAEQFERIKMQVRAADIYSRDDVSALARRYGQALTVGLAVDDVEAWPEILQSVTEEEVIAAARTLLDRSNAVTGWLTGPEDGDIQEVTQ